MVSGELVSTKRTFSPGAMEEIPVRLAAEANAKELSSTLNPARLALSFP
jgi:hypothetical protein